MYNEDLLGSTTISERMGIHKTIIIRTLKENGIILGPSGRRNIGGKSASDKRYQKKNKDELNNAYNMVALLESFKNFPLYKSLSFIGPYLSVRNTKKYNHEAFLIGWNELSENELYDEYVDKRSGKDKIKPINGVEKMTNALNKILKYGLKKIKSNDEDGFQPSTLLN